MSYFSQMVGLTAQNFLAGAAGLTVGVAFIRGFVRQKTDKLGNFWVDLVRALLWVLLPLALVGALVLVWQGVPMNFHLYTQVTTVAGATQTITQGPVAALEIIKNLGTNGAAGSSMRTGPFLTKTRPRLPIWLPCWPSRRCPAAFTNTFGRMIGNPRQGWMLYVVMTVLFVAGLVVCGWSEQRGNRFLKNGKPTCGPARRRIGPAATWKARR